jgi:LuxR family maltose regulon positive regulatory protein
VTRTSGEKLAYRAARGVPRPVPGLVRRSRLFDRLDGSVDARVTLISAPAGSGKTQLVTSWLLDAPIAGPVAWYSVERGERDAMRFWGGVIGALRSAGALEGAKGLQGLTPAPRGVAGDFARRLAECLDDLKQPGLLVLDDLHELHAPDALDGLAELLTGRPPALQIVLITRRDPPLRLDRLRVAGGLREIRGSDLQFSLEEAGEMLARAGLHMPDDGAARLHERTEGWAAGLRLAALALGSLPPDDRDRFVDEFSGSERTVAGYLMGEVLAAQPPSVRTLLLRTSVLERVNGPLANLLAGVADGQCVLQGLEEANAFVEAVDAGRTWFRYHHLLADFLRAELDCEAPDQVAVLHRAAARWHAEHGLPVDAIRHAQAGRDWDLAADQLMEHWFSLFLDGRRATLHALVAAFPCDVLRSDAELATLVAADRMGEGKLGDADAYLELAKRLAGSVPEPRWQRFQVTLAVVELVIVRTRGDFEAAIDHAHAILAPEGGAPLADVVSNEDVRGLALMNLGIVELWARRPADAERHLQEGLALGRRIGRPYLALSCAGPLALVAQLHGRLQISKQRAREAVALADDLACPERPVAGVAYFALGAALMVEGNLIESESWLDRGLRTLHGVYDVEAAILLRFRLGNVLYGQRRYEEALECWLEAERAHRRLGTPHYMASFLSVWQLRARIELGDTESAARALADADSEVRGRIEWRCMAAALHLAEDRPRAAAEVLAPVVDGSLVPFHFGEEVEVLLLEAVARDRLGQTARTWRAIERALDLAEPQGWYSLTVGVPLVRPLLDEYRRIRTAHVEFVTEVLDRLAGAVPDEPLPAPLTERELVVLRFLPTNLSAPEIAGELLLSVHTVKSHMRSIYGKLEVHRRSQAVERARALGLLGRTNRAIGP